MGSIMLWISGKRALSLLPPQPRTSSIADLSSSYLVLGSRSALFRGPPRNVFLLVLPSATNITRMDANNFIDESIENTLPDNNEASLSI